MVDISKFSRDELVLLLEASGYLCDDITDVRFEKFSGLGYGVYNVRYPSPDEIGATAEGTVFVSRRNGRLQAEF